MFDIGGPELLLVLFIFLLLFGADKLPGLAKGFGKAMREFKKASSGVEEEIRRAMEEPPIRKPFAPVKQVEAQKPAPPPSVENTAPVEPPDRHGHDDGGRAE